MTNAAEMADFAQSVDFEDLSDEVIDETKKRLLDSIAIASGATDAEPVEILRETIDELDHDGSTSIWGSSMKTSPPLATALNGEWFGISISWMPTFSPERYHPSNNVAPAVVAAEYTDSSGVELIEAIGIAYEIHYQLGKTRR